MTLARRLGAAVAAAIVIAVLTIKLGDYRDFQIAQISAYVAVVAGLTLLIGTSRQNSIRHRAFIAIGGYPTAAVFNQLHLNLVLIFVASTRDAAPTGRVMGGSLLAVVTGTVSPGGYTLALSILLLTAAVLGGLGSLPGAIWGASLVLVLVQTYLQNVAISHGLASSTSASIAVIAYGVVLVLVMLVFPAGIQGGLRRLFGPVRPTASAPYHQMRRRWPAKEHQEEQTK